MGYCVLERVAKDGQRMDSGQPVGNMVRKIVIDY